MLSAVGEYVVYDRREDVRARIKARVEARKKQQEEGRARAQRTGVFHEESRVAYFFRGWLRRRADDAEPQPGPESEVPWCSNSV